MPDALLKYRLSLTLFKVNCAHETIEKTFLTSSPSFDVHKKEKREKVGEREKKKNNVNAEFFIFLIRAQPEKEAGENQHSCKCRYTSGIKKHNKLIQYIV